MKKFYKIMGALILFFLGVIVAFLIFYPNNNKKTKLNPYIESENNNIAINTMSDAIPSAEMQPIDDMLFFDFTDQIESSADKQQYIEDIKKNTTEHLTYIFNYSDYTDDYKNTLKANICQENYGQIDKNYVDKICNSFTDKGFKSEAQEVHILKISIGDGDINEFSAMVLGYIKVKASSDKLPEDEYYIPFQDDICYKNGDITRFSTSFDHIFQIKDFDYGVVYSEGGLATIKYTGNSGYPFNLSQYDPVYDEIQNQKQKEVEEYEKQLQSETDATKEE